MSNLVTVSSIIDKVRDILKDSTSGSYRWEDAILWDFLEDAQREVLRLAPYAYVNATGTQVQPAESPSVIIAGTNNLCVHSAFSSALIDYVLSQAYSKDADEGNHDLAAKYESSFYAKVKAV